MTFEPCPACGLSRRVLEHNARVYAPPFGEPVEYTAPFLRCLDCTDSARDHARTRDRMRIEYDDTPAATADYIETIEESKRTEAQSRVVAARNAHLDALDVEWKARARTLSLQLALNESVEQLSAVERGDEWPALGGQR